MPDYAAHEAVYFSQAITADDFAMKKNPKYVNKVVAPTLEPISSIGGFRTLPDYSFDTMPDDYVALVLIGGFGWNTPVAEKVMPIIKSAIEQEKVIGAICNAASFMAKCGIDRETTSKTLQKSSVIQKISVTYDKRIAGVHEVTCGLGTSTEWIQSEQSVVVGGYDAFVVNNINVTNQEINDKIIGVIAIGPIVKGPQGAECVRWNTKEKKWESKWTRSDVSSVSMIPAVSIKSEMVFVCGWNDASGWEVTGLDWKSGATRHRSILGKNNRANGAYAIIQYLANGDLLFNSVAGPIRVKY